MRIEYKPSFKKKYKKLHNNQLVDINAAINYIASDVAVGQLKKANLSGVRVYKFKMVNQLTLLAYRVEEDGGIVLLLLDFGSHENFYRDLKN